MTWFETIVAAHLAVTNAVSHSRRLKSDRYFVWQEDGGKDLEADDIHAEKAMTGRTDLYTKTELDPWSRDIERAFDAHGIAWSLYSTDYEEDTGFWHWSWDWEVTGNDGEDQL